MTKISDTHVPYNTGWAGELKKGQVIRITATTTVDFVFFRLQNLRERFDQARTKVYNMKLFISTGDKLMGRNNQHMMTIIADGFKKAHTIYRRACVAAIDSNWQSKKAVSGNTIPGRSLRFPTMAATRTIQGIGSLWHHP